MRRTRDTHDDTARRFIRNGISLISRHDRYLEYLDPILRFCRYYVRIHRRNDVTATANNAESIQKRENNSTREKL